ncbi:hypothetical protein BD310DRAFT_821376 [Dichomitus squalens]|uniref:Uncharacterized protein n=1 Tax=Dichomitus squalens TaxID=114155 RepID=A0A4Q9PT32_9APHY|nr:hypothetical protein BD310DRAFT_821376 [Dichomitus squalens]
MDTTNIYNAWESLKRSARKFWVLPGPVPVALYSFNPRRVSPILKDDVKNFVADVLQVDQDSDGVEVRIDRHTYEMTKKLHLRIREEVRVGTKGKSSAEARIAKEIKETSKALKKVARRRDRVSVIAQGHRQELALLQSQPPCEPPAACQPLASSPQPSSRQAMREAQFAEKHMGVPRTIYLATKAINGQHPSLTKSVEGHGRETHRSPLVRRARAHGLPFCGTDRRPANKYHPPFNQSGAVVPEDVFANFDEGRVGTIVDFPRRDGYGPVPMDVTAVPPGSPMKGLRSAPLEYPTVEMEETSSEPTVCSSPPSHCTPALPQSQRPPTMSTYCRNLGHVSNEMAYALRNIRAANAREQSRLPQTTPVRVRTRAGPTRARVVPPTPVKSRRQGRLVSVGGPY